ncbi:MAG: carbamoyltransferase [Anaerolineales bacterium]
MNILGLSCYYHDSAAVLLQDGELIAAAMEERFSRKKHDSGFPYGAIQYCLEAGNLKAADLDYVVFYEKPLHKFGRILLNALGTYPRSAGVWREAMIGWMNDKLWIKTHIQNRVGIQPNKIVFCNHHMAHAASAFFASPFDQAAILTIDGVGEWSTTTLGEARGSFEDGNQNNITLFAEQRYPHSLGLLYSAFTAFLGFKVNNGEYKVMGMSPYGEPKYLDLIEKVVTVRSDGSFLLNMEYFSFHYSPTRTFNDKFEEIFGEPRVPESEFFTAKANPERATSQADMEKNQYYADIAASIQRFTEDTLLKIATNLHARTGHKNLVMAGGVALNSVANYRLLTETPFENLYIQPAAGDDGGALGAALWMHHMVLKQPRRYVMTHTYYGKEYGPDDIRTFLERKSIAYQTFKNDDDMLDRIADLMTQGKVIGFYQGRFEWGPRALGNRSIMADPRREEMKEVVNVKIKFREPFRPFAPVVLAEHAAEYFHLPDISDLYPPRFMLMVTPVREDKLDVAPATTHEGGTGRLQTITAEANYRYYEIVRRFGEKTGVPITLNTSFNLRGEPMVTTPENAWNTFSESGIDALAIGPYLVEKE